MKPLKLNVDTLKTLTTDEAKEVAGGTDTRNPTQGLLSGKCTI